MSEEITLQTITNDKRISVEYSDDDIVIIDNVRNLVDPQVTRMNMHLLTICTGGRAHGSINGQEIELRKNQVAVCPPNVTLTNLMVSPDFDFKAMFFTTRILQSFLREKMKPYIEKIMQQAHEKGTPVMRPLFYDFPEDGKAWETEDAYMFGPDILVAPVMYAGQTTRSVYLPAGAVWTNYWTGDKLEGGQTVSVEAPLEQIPLFMKDEFHL